jgi:antitoxin ParD1/3/4
LTAIAAAESFRGDPNRERDMPLPIPPEFERAVLERVRSGMYDSADEVLFACLKALEREEHDHEAKLERLRQDLDVAIEEAARGEVIDGEVAFAQAEEEVRREFQVGLGELDRGERLYHQEVLARLSDPRTRPELRRFVEKQVQSGRFQSTREVVEAALVLLQHEQPRFDEEMEALRREIDLGIESAEREELIPGDEVVARIRARLRGAAR